MGTGMKILRAMDRAAQSAARERARREKDQIRRQKQLARDRIRQSKEEARLQVQLERENIKADKEKVKADLAEENEAFEKRVSERRTIRLDFLNNM